MSFFDSSSARRNRQQGGAQPMPGEQRVVRFRDAQMLSAPDTSASVVGLLQSGARVTLLAVADDGRYLRIQTEGGDTGWVDALVLGPAQTAASVPAPAAPPAYAPPIAQPRAAAQAPLAYNVPPQPAPGDAWASPPPAQAPTVIAPSAYAGAQPPSGWPAAMQPAAAQQQAPAYPPVQPSAPPAQPGPAAYAPAQQPNVYSYPPAASPAQTAAPAQNSYGYGQPSSAPAQSSCGYPPQQPNYGVPVQRANYGIGAQSTYAPALAAGLIGIACALVMALSLPLAWYTASGEGILGLASGSLTMIDYSKSGSDGTVAMLQVIGVAVAVGLVGVLRLARVIKIEASRALFALVGVAAVGEAVYRVVD